jgi:leucyl/phenylalanyl-tRNA--protein transferase
MQIVSDNNTPFPDPETSNKEGLLLVGGELTPQRVLEAYSQGIFPWYTPESPVLWWSPDPRLILIPNEFKLTRSLKKSLKKPYRLTIDTVFHQVILACANCSNRANNTWIIEDMIQTYTQLHTMGYAHSFELWQEEQLVGGLYGISLGRAFFGESMFHTLTDTSKIVFYHLCQKLIAWNFNFIDCQLPTHHLQSLGAKIISRKAFLKLLKKTLKYPTKQGIWSY